MKTSELQGGALDWAVTKCEGYDHEVTPGSVWGMWGWATDWAQGGPIIEREGMQLQMEDVGEWHATMWWDDEDGQREVVMRGPTPLIAAMRCYVASKLGDDVEIPNELTTGESK